MEKRPMLNRHISIKDFRDFYWYKEELQSFCRREGLDTRGGKIELAKRIEIFLTSGKRMAFNAVKTKAISKFDWSKEKLSPETIITDSYKNTQNVRMFFLEHIGKKFRFNVQFMAWFKSAQGKTLGDAIVKWEEIARHHTTQKEIKDIAPQFEYNTYIRDFLRDNPFDTKETAIACWSMKKQIRGHNRYLKTDLEL